MAPWPSCVAHGRRYMAISDEDRIAAEAWMKRDTKQHPKAVAARYDRRVGRIVVSLDNNVELMFRPHLAQGLEHAKRADLAVIEISASGMGLHWPGLDADLYVPSLLGGVFGSKRWMAQQLGRAGGRVRSEAKTISSRENGHKGGRPRKGAAQ
jgi:hypothetical protein